MGTFYDSITDKQASLISESKIFFVASALFGADENDGHGGPVNVSPKGGSPLHIIDANTVAYLDYPGSGNETARHALQGGAVTVMIMATGERDSAIVRLYGKARILLVDESPLAKLLCASSRSEVFTRFRQIIEVKVHKTQTSCGYGVPHMEVVQDRKAEHCGRRFKDPKK